MRKSVLAATTALVVASGAIIGQASAADLDYMPAPAPAPAPFVPTWQGFYIGGHIGYGEADFGVRQEMDFYEFNDPEVGDNFWDRDDNGDDIDDIDQIGSDDFFPGILNTFRSSLSANGLIGGVQGGYNWQMDSLVFGIEGDVSFADWGQSSNTFDAEFDDVDGLLDDEDAFGSASASVDMLASVRGRVGFAMDSMLIYGTGGVAWADADARASIFFDEPTVVDNEPAVIEHDRTGRANFNDVGFVVGGGMGWMVIPQTFSVGVEGLYYFFDEKKTLIDDRFELENGDEIEIRSTASLDDAWVIRARADFHF